MSNLFFYQNDSFITRTAWSLIYFLKHFIPVANFCYQSLCRNKEVLLKLMKKEKTVFRGLFFGLCCFFHIRWIDWTENLLSPPLFRGMTGKAFKNPIKRAKKAWIFCILGKSWSWAVQWSIRAHQIVSFKKDSLINHQTKT